MCWMVDGWGGWKRGGRRKRKKESFGYFSCVWCMFTCVCALVCGCDGLCVHACGDHRSVSAVSSYSPFHSLRQGLSLGPQVCRIGWSSSPTCSGDLLSPHPKCWDYKLYVIYELPSSYRILIGAGYPNSDPHTCKANTSTEPSEA